MKLITYFLPKTKAFWAGQISELGNFKQKYFWRHFTVVYSMLTM